MTQNKPLTLLEAFNGGTMTAFEGSWRIWTDDPALVHNPMPGKEYLVEEALWRVTKGEPTYTRHVTVLQVREKRS